MIVNGQEKILGGGGIRGVLKDTESIRQSERGIAERACNRVSCKIYLCPEKAKKITVIRKNIYPPG